MMTTTLEERIAEEVPVIIFALAEAARQLPESMDFSWAMAIGLVLGRGGAAAELDDDLVHAFRSAIQVGRKQIAETPDDEL